MVSGLIWLPQALASWKNRNDHEFLSGLSVGTLLLQLANALIWFAYSWSANASWAGAAGFMTAPMVLMLLVLTSRRHDGATDPPRATAVANA